jgi:hypothetical protein
MKKNILIILAVVIAALVGMLVYNSTQAGFIKIDTSNTTVTLKGPWSSIVRVGPDREPVKASAGFYRPRRAKIAKQSNGDKWQIFSYGPWQKLGKIEVTKDQTTTIKLGEPLLVKADVDSTRRAKTGNRISIGFSIVGQAGEKYSSRIKKNNRDTAAPKLKIVDQEGNILASGKFEYG